jgi:hypothetical protein
MAARNLTGLAWIRAAGNKSGAQKNAPECSTWIGRIWAVIHSSIESLLRPSVRVDADVRAAVHRHACHFLISLHEHSERRAALSV